MIKKALFFAVAAVFLYTTIIPNHLLAEVSATIHKGDPSFPDTYEQSRDRFRTYDTVLSKRWSEVSETSIPVSEAENLSIDLLKAEANASKDTLIVLSSGTHGIEGYTGSAMQDLFMKDFAGKLNPDTTGVYLIHSINPWGMKNNRRYNENNVDLNRNFISDWSTFDLNVNKTYKQLENFFEPEKKIGSIVKHDAEFTASLAKTALTVGTDQVESALLTGQYTNPKGVYYGGSRDEKSTVLMKREFNSILETDYKQIIHIDLHTGYGPRYQMSIFSSSAETLTQEEAEAAYSYPLVFTPDSEEYYASTGDLTEYFTALAKEKAPEKTFYSTTFEFGTLGDGTVDSIQSLKRTIEENQLYHYGASSSLSRLIIEGRYKELFYPHENKWRSKATADFSQALTGVLTYKKAL
ncbi:M14 family metallopeptidase [Metabacillus mangrovi]|uniref:M14 family metallopeptidase n=1 Tax=Metabacillus mangrovi TaxID=1491830 RepID=UPI0012BAA80D|nr:M14 family metallopeptidase [Metabacillus mangrovi]